MPVEPCAVDEPGFFEPVAGFFAALVVVVDFGAAFGALFVAVVFAAVPAAGLLPDAVPVFFLAPRFASSSSKSV